MYSISMLDKVQEAREHKDKKEAYFHPGSKRYPGGEDMWTRLELRMNICHMRKCLGKGENNDKGVWNSEFVWEHPDSRLLLEFEMYRRMSENETKNRSKLVGTSINYVDTLKGVKQGSDIDRMQCIKKSLQLKCSVSI